MSWLTTIIQKAEIPQLKSVSVVKNPSGELLEYWSSIHFDEGRLAAYFTDIVRAEGRIREAIAMNLKDIRLTVESNQLTIAVHELSERFIGVFIFQNPIPLGMVRWNLKKLGEAIAPHLPSETLETVSETKRLFDFIARYAPDPHMMLRRVALKTKIPYAKLLDPDQLQPEETTKIKSAAEDILGTRIEL